VGPREQVRFSSLDDLVSCTKLRQDELRTLADIGALVAVPGAGSDRRTALWQAERAGRPAGELLRDREEPDDDAQLPDDERLSLRTTNVSAGRRSADGTTRVLPAMSLAERVQADYDGTGLTIGPHPMALVRGALATRGVLRASDLPRERAGRRVRVAGAVIVRQRPGTAKGFVFLSLEDETGIANVIVTPDVFDANRRTLVEEPYLIVEGALQNQDGAVSVKADRIDGLRAGGPELASHDFH
jgi:error-prone DNA polymerase